MSEESGNNWKLFSIKDNLMKEKKSLENRQEDKQRGFLDVL